MPRIPGRPLEHPEEISNRDLLDAALTAMISGVDQNHDTRARGWASLKGYNHDDSDSEENPVQYKEWYEELQELDEVLSESLETNPTLLPATDLLSQVEILAERLDEWYLNALPNFHRRHVRYIQDELGEISRGLRENELSTAEAQQRLDDAKANMDEMFEYSNYGL